MDLSGNAEIDDFDISGAVDHDISRFDVPVDHFRGVIMGIVQSSCNLLQNGKNHFKSHRTFFAFPFEPTAQICSLDTLHNEIVAADRSVIFQSPVDCDILMVQC